jgi:aryl-alcohol dehydrogenase-like predicted oxidoreductase
MGNLALGTAQFGLPYGIANQIGQVNHMEASHIIELARLNKIDTLDTAIAYGQSENCLGQIGVCDFKVVTKLPALPEDVVDVAFWVQEQMQDSLRRLNMTGVYGLLLHRSQQLTDSKRKVLVQTLEQLKKDGIVQKIGVSIYDHSELTNITNYFPIDLVQSPYNLIDQSLQTSGWLKKLFDSNIEIHTRSTFLQGLLLMPTAAIPEKFKYWFPLFNKWHSWLLDNNLSAIQACFGFIKSYSQISKIITGVDSAKQFKQLIDLDKLPESLIWPDIQCSDSRLINPSNWNLL